jgi:hypothetical protein
MSDENPTEYDIIRDIDIEKEQFLRGFLSRQRELQRKSLAMVANLAQANADLILTTGLMEVAAKRTSKMTKDTTNVAADNLLAQRAKREAANGAAIDNLRQALQANVDQE